MSDLGDWLAGVFGRRPRDLAPYERALTHGSQAKANYERLEFLGDRVLGLIVAEWLYELFATDPEGSLSKRLNAYAIFPTLHLVTDRPDGGSHSRRRRARRDSPRNRSYAGVALLQWSWC